MNPQDPRAQLEQVIALAKFGNQPQARKLVFQLLEVNPGYLPGWLWAAELAKDQRERAFCLRRILAIDPNHTAAKEYLTRLEYAERAQAKAAVAALPVALQTPPIEASTPTRSFSAWLEPFRWLGGLALRFFPITLLIIIGIAAYFYYFTNTSFFGLAAPEFDSFTIATDYSQIESPSYTWKILFEANRDSIFEGQVNQLLPIRELTAPIMTHDILVTSGDYSDSRLVKTWLRNHAYRWESLTESEPQGKINLLHALPMNEEIYTQLLRLRPGDMVRITGREILSVQVYTAEGNYRGEWRDAGCNTLLVKVVEKIK